MSRYRRAAVPGASYFFTVVTERRQPILTDPAVRQALREAIVSVRHTLPFRIGAWVLLPDHLHAIWTLPEGDSDFPPLALDQAPRHPRLRRGLRPLRIPDKAPLRQAMRHLVATPLLGAPDPRRTGFPLAHGLPARQSGEARARPVGRGLAVVFVPPLCAAGRIPRRLGGRGG